MVGEERAEHVGHHRTELLARVDPRGDVVREPDRWAVAAASPLAVSDGSPHHEPQALCVGEPSDAPLDADGEVVVVSRASGPRLRAADALREPERLLGDAGLDGNRLDGRVRERCFDRVDLHRVAAADCDVHAVE